MVCTKKYFQQEIPVKDALIVKYEAEPEKLYDFHIL